MLTRQIFRHLQNKVGQLLDNYPKFKNPDVVLQVRRKNKHDKWMNK